MNNNKITSGRHGQYTRNWYMLLLGVMVALACVLVLAVRIALAALTYAGPITVTANMGSFSPSPVLVNGSATAGLSAYYTPPSGAPEGQLSASYDWSVSSVQYKAAQTDTFGSPPANSYTDSISPNQPSSNSGATLTFTPLIAGYWQVSTGCSVTVTDTTTNQYWGGSGNAGPATVQSTPLVVDSIQLIPNPSTVTSGNETETYNYHIGDTLTRSDFTITTTPAGYGNSNLVTFSISPSTLQIGDNTAVASCGNSSASQDLTGVQCSASWGAASTADDGSGGASGNIDVGFSAKVQGASGNYSVAGGGIVGTAPSGSLADGVATSGIAEVNPGSVDASFNDTLTVSPSTGSSSASLSAAPGTVQPNGVGVGGTLILVGLVLDVAKAAYHKFAGTITTPKIPYIITESLNANALDKWNQNTITAQASGTISGAFYFYALVPLYCQSPQSYLTVKTATKTVIDTTTNTPYSVDVDADLFNGGFTPGGLYGISFSGATFFNNDPGGEQPSFSELGWSTHDAVNLNSYSDYAVLSLPFTALVSSGQWNGPKSVEFIFQWE